MKEITYNILISLLGIIALPFVLYAGFWVTYQLEIRFDTPRYIKYGFPLRTDFWIGCQFYGKYKTILKSTGINCKAGEGWGQCTGLNEFTEIIDGVIIDRTDDCNYVDKFRD